jgi:transcriptional regulator with XRE-family HTH domain
MKAQITVARNLRRLRVVAGLSQEALAADARVDRTYVGRVERSLENPSVAVLERLAKALGCDIAEFFDQSQVTRPVQPLPGGRRPKKAKRRA